MPAIPLPHSSNFREIFAHPTDPIEFGPPLHCLDHFPVEERGQRRHWRYIISYAKRTENQTFILKCPSLPLEISRKLAISRVVTSQRQSIKEDVADSIDVVRRNIYHTLKNRKDLDHMFDVNKLLNSFPLDNATVHESYYDALSKLSALYGNEVYVEPKTYARGDIRSILCL